MAKTKFNTKCQILSDFYTEHKGEERFEDYFAYSDLGLPLAYAIATGIVEKTPLAKGFVNEAFELLLEILGLEDEGYKDLEDLLGYEEE
jgi:hypothetical protein